MGNRTSAWHVQPTLADVARSRLRQSCLLGPRRAPAAAPWRLGPIQTVIQSGIVRPLFRSVVIAEAHAERALPDDDLPACRLRKASGGKISRCLPIAVGAGTGDRKAAG